jgi:hypothetical protein
VRAPIGRPGRQARLQRGLNRRQARGAAPVVRLAPEARVRDALDGRLPVPGSPLRAQGAQEALQPLVQRLARLCMPVPAGAACMRRFDNPWVSC